MSIVADALHSIHEFVKNIERDIVRNNRKTKNYMDYEADDKGARIKVPFWFPTFETGRGKRKSTTPTPATDKRFKTGFSQRLYEWMKRNSKFKTFTERGKINEAEGLRWWINKHGTKLFRKGGRKDIFSNVITDKRMKQLTDKLGSIIIDDIKSEIVKLNK